MLMGYNLDPKSISRLILSQFPNNQQQEAATESTSLFGRFPMLLLSHVLKQSLNDVLETDSSVQNVKKAFLAMVQAFVSSPTATLELKKLSGRSNTHALSSFILCAYDLSFSDKTVDLRTSRPFIALAEALLEVKDEFHTVCAQMLSDEENRMETLTDEQWFISPL
jgi:hypothetical protein